jgi:serine protease Do
MHTTARALLLFALLTPPAAGRAAGAADAAGARELQALQQAVARVVAEAEPAVACVLVSRSDGYRRYEREPSPDVPGKLGRFIPPPLPAATRFGQPDPQQKAILALDLSSPDHVPESFGSGVVIDAAQGLVLTNAHVVRNATKLYVRLPADKDGNDRGSWADIHASDPRSDLAVLNCSTRTAST